MLEQLKDDKVALDMIGLGGDVTGNGISKLVFTILSPAAENERERFRERIGAAKRLGASKPLQRRQTADRFRYRKRQTVPNPSEQGAVGQQRRWQARSLPYP
jgi:DNA invertase Pin-like site-specific DNA recombinase